MFWGASPEPDSRNMAGKSPARVCPRTFGRANVPGIGARWLAPPSVTACACVSSTCACVSSGSRPCGRGYLAVWPLVSGRMASGLSPRGVASFYTLGWGSGVTRVEWSAIYPVPAPHLFPTPSSAPCALTPQGCDCLSGGLHGASPLLAVSG